MGTQSCTKKHSIYKVMHLLKKKKVMHLTFTQNLKPFVIKAKHNPTLLSLETYTENLHPI